MAFKKYSAFGLIALALSAPLATRAATVTFNLSGGFVYDELGGPLGDGKLVQLIASTTDTAFSSPTPSSFVSGDDLVILSFALDSSVVGVPGTFQIAQQVDTSLFVGLNAGDSLLLRWFNVDSVGQTSPGIARYGQFRTDSIVDGSDAGWFFPAAASVSLNFVTNGAGGSQPEAAGNAVESTTPIPEPSTWVALAGAASLAWAAWRRRRG